MNTKISIIMPVYNVAEYIEKSLESVCCQKFSDYEIILVNDGTKDDSIEKSLNVLNKYKVKYQLIEQNNMGLPAARNTGIRNATGEYVCFIDSDDVIEENHLQTLWEACQKHEADVAYAMFELTYENHRNGSASKESESIFIERKELLDKFLVRKLKIHCCALLIKKDFLNNNGLWFNEELRYGEDIQFMWRVFPRLKGIACTQMATYKYLQRPNSLMTSQNIERVEKLIDVFENTVKSLRELYPKDSDVWNHLLGKASMAFYRTFSESSDYDIFLELLEKTDYKEKIRGVLGIKSLELNLLAVVLLLSPRIFNSIVRYKRETVEKR